MTLSRSSVLHYWSARYGPLPVIGGRPTHSRNSVGMVADASGLLYDCIINTPRWSWETDRSTTANERRAMLLLEMARQNIAPVADITNVAWGKISVTVSGGIPDPKGGTGAYTVTSTASSAFLYSTGTGASTSVANAIWVRQRGGSGNATINVFNADELSGTVVLPPNGPWVRATIASVSTNRYIGLQFFATGVAIDVYCPQQELAATSSSEILNTVANTTRATDSFSWNYQVAPQASIFHIRFVESGTAGLWCAGDAAPGSTGPRLLTYVPSAGIYRVFYQPVNGGTSYTADVSAGVTGDTIDHAVVLSGTGQIRLIQSINGAAVTDSGLVTGAALPSAWSATTLQLNQFNTSTAGVSKWAEFKQVKYADVVASTAQWIMDELRAFELSPAGEVL